MSEVLMGVDCCIKKGSNVIAEMSTWSLTKGADLVKGAAFLERDERIYGAATKRWSISVSGMLDITDTNGQTTLRTAFNDNTKMDDIKAYVDSTHYYTTTDTAASGDLGEKLVITAVSGDTGNIIVTISDSGTIIDGSASVSYDSDTKTMTVDMESAVTTQATIETALEAFAIPDLIDTVVADSGATAWTLGAQTDTITLSGGTSPGCRISSLEIGADRGATVTVAFNLEGHGLLTYN